MRKLWLTFSVVLVVAVLAGGVLMGCPAPSPGTPAQPVPTDPSPTEGTASAAPVSPEAHLQIDIGDITYGVYASIDILEPNVLPSMNVSRLSSPRFDRRTQLLTVNLSPPYPEKLPFTILFGSTRFLKGHTVMLTVHTFREYLDATGQNVVEEILTFDRVLGNDRSVLTPELIDLDPFAGLTSLPSTMLVYCEVEAWLFLNTDVESFDPAAADLNAADYKRYPGYNPARVNLLGGGTQE
jgi:hypothetical protein